MSGIVLSASVRQNLLSLQSTADLLATTQNRLATGKKINTALDNPTNFFTASSLDSRAGDINSLLDGIGNGVQVLQAANTGITSLQKLIDSAKSVANQALQASVGYSTKSNFSATISGASADNLLGAASYSDAAAAAGSVVNDNHTLTPINNTVQGSQVLTNNLLGLQDTAFTGSTLAPTQTTAATLGSSTNISGALSTAGFAAGDSFNITIGATTKTITFYDSAAAGVDPTAGNIKGVDLNGTTGVGSDLVSAINTAFGGTVAALTANHLQLTATNLTNSITVSDNSSSTASGFGFSGFSSGSVSANATTAPVTATAATLLNGTTNNATGALNLSGKSITVNGKTIAISGTGAANVTFLNGGTIGADQTLGDLVSAINTVAGSTVAAISGGKLTLTAHAADTTDFSIADVSTGNALQQLGLAAGASATRNVVRQDGGASHPAITGFSALASTASSSSSGIATSITAGESITVNGQTLNFVNGGGTSTNTTGGQIDIATATVGDVLSAIDKISGTFGTANASSVSGGKITLGTGTASSLTLADSSGVSGTILAKLGLAPGVTARTTPPATTPITGATGLTGSAGPTSNALPTAFSASDTIVVNNKTITFASSGSTSTNANGGVINITSGSVQDVVDAIDKITGTFGTANASTISGGKVTLHTGTAADLVTSGTGLAKLGLAGGTTARTATGSLSGKTLTIGATGNGAATSITFGSGANQVKSLNDLNNALASNNLLATLDGSGKLTIQTTNDAASSTIGTIAGTVTDAGQVFAAATASAPVQDQTALLNRSNLVAQYNNILDQITTTAQDASFNGIDLLNGDQLKLTFNETGSSTLKIQGGKFDFGGLGLSKLTAGSDFLDNSSANSTLAKLSTASSTLRTQASAFGSNLSIVQVRQDFSKNLINVLQTGSANLTLADTNEEAANSQALSTRQSIAVSALSLANQSQQSVLQLLR